MSSPAKICDSSPLDMGIHFGAKMRNWLRPTGPKLMDTWWPIWNWIFVASSPLKISRVPTGSVQSWGDCRSDSEWSSWINPSKLCWNLHSPDLFGGFNGKIITTSLWPNPGITPKMAQHFKLVNYDNLPRSFSTIPRWVNSPSFPKNGPDNGTARIAISGPAMRPAIAT